MKPGEQAIVQQAMGEKLTPAEQDLANAILDRFDPKWHEQLRRALVVEAQRQ